MALDEVSRKVFTNPDMINLLVSTYNDKASIDHQISDKDKQILLKDPELASAIFSGGGLQDSLKNGKTSVRELEAASKANPALLEFLSHPDQQALLKDGVLTVAQLKDMPPEKLKEAGAQLDRGNQEGNIQAGKILGMNDDKAKAFDASIKREEAEQFAPVHTPTSEEMRRAASAVLFGG